jgi:hypothetical protein
MYIIKKGVDLSNMDPAMGYVTHVAIKAFRMIHMDCVLTSAFRKGDSGLHGQGKAHDYRAKHLDEQQKKIVLYHLKTCLTDDFDIVLHGEGDNIHFHVEYDKSIS